MITQQLHNNIPAVTVSDDNILFPLSNQKWITITVNDVNTLPILGHISNKTGRPKIKLSFTVSATDADIPADPLTFTMIAGPVGDDTQTVIRSIRVDSDKQPAQPIHVHHLVADSGTPALTTNEQSVKVTISR